MRHLVEQLEKLEDRLRDGGGSGSIEKQHRAGKMTARERIAALLDPGALFLEIGLLIAYDRYDGQAPAAGVVTGVGRIEGRPAVVVANDATVKAGAWWPETITKILRAQEIAMRNRLPIVYLVDSAGVNLPYQDGIFPGQYGAGRIFLLQLADAAQAAHPADCRRDGPVHRRRRLSAGAQRRHHHGGGRQFHGARRPQPGERRHRAVDRFRAAGRRASAHRGQRRGALHGEGRRRLPGAHPRSASASCPRPHGARADPPREPARDTSELYGVLPADHRLPYEIEEVHRAHFRWRRFQRISAGVSRPKCCAPTRGWQDIRWRSIANRRGFLKAEGRPRIGGIIYAETARKVAYFVETAERLGQPLIYLQDVSGFMVGPEAEREGIIRAGAEMVETMSCATVPKIVLTLNHASGAGYYAMAGQGFDPNFTFNWPTARIGVMEGESAIQALYAVELAKHKGTSLPEDLQAAIRKTRADYERWLDARYAAARGHCDAVIDPLDRGKC